MPPYGFRILTFLELLLFFFFSFLIFDLKGKSTNLGEKFGIGRRELIDYRVTDNNKEINTN